MDAEQDHMMMLEPELTIYLFRTIPIAKSNIHPRFTKARVVVQAFPSPSHDQALFLFGDTDPKSQLRKSKSLIEGLLVNNCASSESGIPILKLNWQVRPVKFREAPVSEYALTKRKVHRYNDTISGVKHVMLANRLPEGEITSKYYVKDYSKELLQLAEDLGLSDYASLPNFQLVLYPVANLFEARLPARNDVDVSQVLIIGSGPEEHTETSISTVLRAKLILRHEQLLTQGFEMFKVLEDWDRACNQLVCLLRHANAQNESKSSRSIRSTISCILENFNQLVLEPVSAFTKKRIVNQPQNKALKSFVNQLTKTINAKSALLFANHSSRIEQNTKLASLEEEFMRGVFSLVRFAPVHVLEEQSLVETIRQVWQQADFKTKVLHDKLGVPVSTRIHKNYQKLATKFQELYFAVKSQRSGNDQMIMFSSRQNALVPKVGQIPIPVSIPLQSRQILAAQEFSNKLYILTQSRKGFEFEQHVRVFENAKEVKSFEVPKILINQALKLGLSYEPNVTFSQGILVQQVFGRHLRHLVLIDLRKISQTSDQIYAKNWTYVQKQTSKSTAPLWMHLVHTSSHIFVSQFSKPRELSIQKIFARAEIGDRITFDLLPPNSIKVPKHPDTQQSQDFVDYPNFAGELTDPKLSVAGRPPWTNPSFQLAPVEGSSLFFTAHKRSKRAPWEPATMLLCLYQIPRRPSPSGAVSTVPTAAHPHTNPNVPLQPLCHVTVSLASHHTYSADAVRVSKANSRPLSNTFSRDADHTQDTNRAKDVDLEGLRASDDEAEPKDDETSNDRVFAGVGSPHGAVFPASLSTCVFQAMLFHQRPYLHIVDSSKQQWSALFCVHRGRFFHLRVRPPNVFGVWGFGRPLGCGASNKRAIQKECRGPSFLPVVSGMGVVVGSSDGHNQVIVSKITLSL